MNKKVNTLLFLLAGTVFNIGIMLLLLILFLCIIRFVITGEGESGGQIFLVALTFAAVMLSVVGSFLIYSRIIKLINKRWDLEKFMEPLFKRKR